MERPRRHDDHRDASAAPSADQQGRRPPEILARLEQAVGEIHDSDSFRRYLDVQSRFHRYSWRNVALILSQRPDATQVAGYNAWLKLHRYVRRGEHGIKILVPMSRKRLEEQGEDAQRVFFGTGTVFDITQTEGEALPVVEVPDLSGEEGSALYGSLGELALREGLSVQETDEGLPGRATGLYTPAARAIRIRPAATLQMTVSLAHELGHHFSGIHGTRPEEECIAESVAYVVCAHFGLETGEASFPYVAIWAKEPKVFQTVLTTIQAVSATMIDRLDGRSGATREVPTPTESEHQRRQQRQDEGLDASGGPVGSQRHERLRGLAGNGDREATRG
jgi:N-terminal domain of anti-restriction factor ArdC